MPNVTISNVEVTCSEYSAYCLSCQCNCFSYHVWIDRQTKDIQRNIGTDYPVIFKSSLAGPGQEGYFRPRTLRLDSAFNRLLFTKMFAEATRRNLFEAAEAKVLADKQSETLRNEEQLRIQRIKNAAGALYDACKKVAEFLAEPYDSITANSLLAQIIQPAIDAAEKEE